MFHAPARSSARHVRITGRVKQQRPQCLHAAAAGISNATYLTGLAVLGDWVALVDGVAFSVVS